MAPGKQVVVQSTEREGEPAATLPKKIPPHSNMVLSLKFGSVHGYPDYERDLAAGKRAVQDVNDLLQASEAEMKRPCFLILVLIL